MPKPKGKGTSQFKKKCVKPTSYPCGFTCIARRNPSGSERVCHNPLKKQAATFTLWLAEQEKRLAKVNAHRTAKGRATYSLREDKLGLVKDKLSATAKTTEKVSDAAIADDKSKGLELRNLALNGKIARNEFVSRWLKESVSPGELKPSKQSLNEKWFARIEKAFVNGKPISQEIINSMTPQQRQYFQILQKRRDESISKKQSGELSLDVIAQPKEKALFNTTKGLIEKYDRIAEEISSIEEDIAIRYNKGKSLLSNSNATIYSRQYVINSSTGKDGSSNTLGEFVILPKSKVDQQRKELLKKTKDESFKKEALSYWKEADLAVAKKLQESESLMKEIRRNIKSLPNGYVANLIASDLVRRGKQGSIYHDTPFIEGVSPFSDSQQLNRVLTENRSRIGLIASPSPEVKPVPSSLQGSEKAINPSYPTGRFKDGEFNIVEQYDDSAGKRKGVINGSIGIYKKGFDTNIVHLPSGRIIASLNDANIYSKNGQLASQEDVMTRARELGNKINKLTSISESRLDDNPKLKEQINTLLDSIKERYKPKPSPVRDNLKEQSQKERADRQAKLKAEKAERDRQYEEARKIEAEARKQPPKTVDDVLSKIGIDDPMNRTNLRRRLEERITNNEIASDDIILALNASGTAKSLYPKIEKGLTAMGVKITTPSLSLAQQKDQLTQQIREAKASGNQSLADTLTQKRNAITEQQRAAIAPSAPDKRLSAILEKQPHEMTEDEFNFARQDILQKLDNIPLNSGEMVRQQDKIAKETREKLKNIGVETYTGSQYSSQGFTFSHAGLGVYYQRSIPPKVRDQANKIIDETKAKIKKLDSDRKQQVDSLGLPPIAFEIIMPGKTHSNYVFYHNIENQQKTEKAIASSKTENDIQSAIAPLEDLAKLRVDKSPKIASGVLLGSERVSEDVGDRYGDGTNAGRYIEYRVRRMPIEEARKYGYTGSGNIALERRPYDDSTTGRYWEGEWQPVHFASNTKELLDQQRGMLGRLESDHPYIKTIKENDRRSKEDEKAKKERDRQAAETARVNYKDWMQTHVNQQYANSLPGKKITLHLDLVGEDDSTPTAPVPATRYGNMAVHKKYRYMDKDGTVHLGSTYSISDPSTGVVVVPSIPTLDQARRLTAVLYHEISDKNPIEWTVDERKKAGNVINAFLNGDRPSHITDNSTPVIREKKKAKSATSKPVTTPEPKTNADFSPEDYIKTKNDLTDRWLAGDKEAKSQFDKMVQDSVRQKVTLTVPTDVVATPLFQSKLRYGAIDKKQMVSSVKHGRELESLRTTYTFPVSLSDAIQIYEDQPTGIRKKMILKT